MRAWSAVATPIKGDAAAQPAAAAGDASSLASVGDEDEEAPMIPASLQHLKALQPPDSLFGTWQLLLKVLYAQGFFGSRDARDRWVLLLLL